MKHILVGHHVIPISQREPISARVRRVVKERDGSTCQLCGNQIEEGQAMHLHHWDHAEGGGPSSVKNLCVAHAICNWAVSTRKKDAAKMLARANYTEWLASAVARKRDRERWERVAARLPARAQVLARSRRR